MLRPDFARIVSTFALSLVAAAPAYALPEVKVGTGFLISPTDANTYYNAQGMTSPAWSEDPEINKLAAALGDDADRIYEYVRNEIDVIPMFGVHAGARGCYIDKACTPFDQTEFMVELLRSAGYTAKYQLGTITLTGAQFNDWFGITNATAARKLLADGGTPATVSDNGSTVTSVTMMHVWVKATIGGTEYAFDPAFKSHAVTSGIDVAAAMGFNGGSFLSGAISGATTATDNGASRVHTMNRSGVRSSMAGFATTLLSYIKNNLADASIEDIIGGRTIVAYVGGPLRQATLPHQASTYGAAMTGDLPLTLRTRMSMYVTPTLTFNWNLNDIYGKQIVYEAGDTVMWPASPQFRVLLGEQDMTGWLNGIVSSGSVSINHPYAAGTSAGVVNGAYMDRSSTTFASPTGAVQILITTGHPSGDLASWQERNHTSRPGYTYFHTVNEQEAPGATPQQIAARRRMGTTLLIQLHELARIIGGLSNSQVLVHDVIGISSAVGTSFGLSQSPGPAATSYMLSVEPSISAISNAGDASQTTKVVRTFAMMNSALEGSVPQQISDSTYQVSAVAQLDWAHAGPTVGNRWYYAATSANWTWVKSQVLTNYHAITNENSSPMRDQAESYINAGYTVFIPRSSSLGPAPEAREKECHVENDPTIIAQSDDYQKMHQDGWGFRIDNMTSSMESIMDKWKNNQLPECTYLNDPDRAGAFIAIHPTTGAVAHISSRENAMGKGGGGTNDVEANPARIFSLPTDFLDKQFSSRAGAQNVDLKAGTLEYTPPPDLVVGNGEYPYSLSFQRSYRSGREDTDKYHFDGEEFRATKTRDAIFGYGGWTSNLHHYATISTSGDQMFGRDDPRAAAQTLATAQAMLSLMADGATPLETLQRQLTGVYAAAWWTDTFALNTITVNQGHSSQAFYKLADGTYVQRGSAQTAELVGTRTLFAPPLRAHGWTYKTCVRLTGAQREVSYYGVWDSSYTTCNGTPDFRHSGEGANMGFSRQVFPYGVTVTWNDTTNTLSNNLGRSISATGTAGQGGIVTDGARTITIARTETEVSVTDALGQVWTYLDTPSAFEVRPPSTPTTAFMRAEYFATGALGVVDKIKDAVGNATTYNLGGGRAASVVDPLGNMTRTMHNKFGNVVRIEDPLGRVSRTDYDNYRRKTKVTAPEGNFTTFTYDAKSNVLTTVETPKVGSGLSPRTVSTKTYDALCNVTLTDTDALGRVTTTAINQTTCLTTSITQPQVAGQSPVTTFAYGAFGKLTQKLDPTGLETQMTINTSNGNVESVIINPGAGGLSITTLFGYDAAGNVTTVTDPRGFVHTGTYDLMRRLGSYTAPVSTNAKTRWTYSVDGFVTKIEQAKNAAQTEWAATTYTYWPTGRVASVTDADGRITRYTYDAASRLSYTIDPMARQAKKIYDAAGQVVEERRGVGSPDEQAYSTMAYTPNGKQAWIKDAKLNQTTYSYDGFDRLAVTTFPDTTHEDLTYSSTNTVLSKRTRGGQLIVNTYDTLDREVTHLVPQPGAAPAITTTTAYDLASRVTGKSDNTGHSLTYAFDTAKRPVSVTQAAPTFTGTRVVSYLLDLAGNKTRTTWADGYYVTYAYDALNRMTTATENGTFLLSTYIYDTLSRRTSLVYGNGAAQGYTYSTQGDLLTLASTLTGTSNTYTNTFSNAHQLASETASNAAWQYIPAAFQTTNYAAANPLNQYVNITVGANPTVTLAYDANGNLTGDGVWTFAYDAQNMLRSAVSAASTSTYQYDPLGRRQMLTEGGTTTTFLHDGDEEIADYAAAVVLRRYVPGPGTDMPIAMVTPSGGSNTRKYFHTNRQGSTIAMSADDGTMAEGPYTYDAYGNGAPATGVPFKYTGRRLDAGTGLYYYRARYYSAALGRFLQVDPVGYGDQMNLYAYVGNDPSNNNDPKGEFAQVLIGAFIGAVTNVAIQVYQNGGDLQKTKDNFNWTSFGVSVVAGAATGGVATMIETSGMSALAGAATDRAASTAIGAVAGIADTAATNPNATAKDYVKGAGIGAAAGFIGANGATLTSVATKSASAATITAVTTSAAVSAIPLINPSNGANSKPPPGPPLPAPANSPPPRVHDVIKR